MKTVEDKMMSNSKYYNKERKEESKKVKNMYV